MDATGLGPSDPKNEHIFVLIFMTPRFKLKKIDSPKTPFQRTHMCSQSLQREIGNARTRSMIVS